MRDQLPRSGNLDEIESAIKSEARPVNIRLRQGEYQFSLAKNIAEFEVERHFPDVKDLVKKLFGEKKTQDQHFLNMIQTILKKMEKSGVIKILPKEKPWELQTYALTSFRFIDVEKNTIVLATEGDFEKTKNLANSEPRTDHNMMIGPNRMIIMTGFLGSITAISLGLALWALTQSSINLWVFLSAFSISSICSVSLGLSFSRRKL